MHSSHNDKFVAYYRVSTQRQGQSGLGLEAQQAAVRGFCKQPIIAEYVEVESGRKDKRPQFAAALAHARTHKATLVIAKLDRLARSVSFIQRLIEGKVPFVCVDMPEANKAMLQISAVFAEHEADMISARTKAALAAAKARGVQLGKHAAVLAVKNRARANVYAAQLAPIIADIRASGARTGKAICAVLNERGVTTSTGGRWHATSVHRLLARLDA